jgi:hypothetical protein
MLGLQRMRSNIVASTWETLCKSHRNFLVQKDGKMWISPCSFDGMVLHDTTRGRAFGQFRTPSRYIKASRSWRSMARKSTPKLQCYSCYPCWQAWWTELPEQNQQATVKMGGGLLRQRNTRKVGYNCITRPYTLPHYHFFGFFSCCMGNPSPNPKGNQSLENSRFSCEHINGAAISRQDGLSSSWTGLSPWKGLASPWLTCVGDIAWETLHIRG